MTQQLKLNDQDVRTLRKLDPDVVLSPDGESATINADIEVTVTRVIDGGVDLI